jgi:hypothetical protein
LFNDDINYIKSVKLINLRRIDTKNWINNLLLNINNLFDSIKYINNKHL